MIPHALSLKGFHKQRNYQSKQSYYDLFTAAGLSWKKSQKRNSKTDPELVEKKNDGTQRMAGSPSPQN
jgi:putative transposase